MTTNQIMYAFLLVQIVGIPATIALCWLAERVGYKKVLMVSVAFWVVNAVCFLLVRGPVHFYLLSLSVGLVIGTTPATARALLALMIDRTRATEMYGFHAFAGRASAVLGPVLFGAVSAVSGSQRVAFSSLLVFFIQRSAQRLRLWVEDGR